MSREIRAFLAKGNRVIIGVDSGELWNAGSDEELEDLMGLPGADHALIVSGIDTTDRDNIKVVLTDPGSGDVAKEYPIEQFIDAWQDSNCFMVATVEPAPLEFNPEMVNFDYELGHLSEISNLAYAEFQELSAPCLELELSDTLLKEQAELLSRAVGDNSSVILQPSATADRETSDGHSESPLIAMDETWDDLSDDNADPSPEEVYNLPEDDFNSNDDTDFSNDSFE